jgi:hypothetical protein
MVGDWCGSYVSLVNEVVGTSASWREMSESIGSGV